MESETRLGSKKAKRSPLKQQPLRLPGESLSDEREELLYSEVVTAAMVAVFAVLDAGLQWWQFLTDAPPRPVPATVLALGAVAWATFRVLRIRPRIHALNLGLSGERYVGQYLDAHKHPDWHVFHDVPGTGFNVDHILVSPHGVFAVETKTYSKPAAGQTSVVYDGTKVLVNGHTPDRDPVAQARAVRDWVRQLLFDTTAINYPVRGVVVFPGWYVESPKGGLRPDVWVLNEKAFLKFVENEPATVKTEDVALAAARLVNYLTKCQ